MNLGNGTVATQFLSWEYLFKIFVITSLQCMAVLGIMYASTMYFPLNFVTLKTTLIDNKLLVFVDYL
jgi:hypothetical protein